MKTSYVNLDLVRSLAVLSVVAAHWWQECVDFHICQWNAATDMFLRNLSFTGVMFFFVHTCLVLMLSMHRAPAAHRGRNFLIRRAFRIYPLCWAAILLALATGLTDHREQNLHSIGWRGVSANFLLMQNIAKGFPNIIGPLWSLCYEVQMYLLLPLLFILLKKFPKRSAVFAAWSAAALLSIVRLPHPLPHTFFAALFPPMFIAGMVAYKLLEKQSDEKRLARFPAWIWPFLVIVLFLLKNWAIGKHSYESSAGACINSCICLLLAVLIPQFAELRQAWIVRPAQQLAKYSYGVYLLHIPALMFVLRYLPRLSLPLKLIVFLALTAVLAVVSFHAIENPLIELGKRLTRPRHASALLPAFASLPSLAASSMTSLAAADSARIERIQDAHGLNHYSRI